VLLRATLAYVIRQARFNHYERSRVTFDLMVLGVVLHAITRP
jgi:hypothetical protein